MRSGRADVPTASADCFVCARACSTPAFRRARHGMSNLGLSKRPALRFQHVSLLDSAVRPRTACQRFPCDKISISPSGTNSILVLRTAEDDEGAIGRHQTGIPDEYEPSLSVRFMAISEQAISSYLVTAYSCVTVLVPDALDILEDVEIGR